MSYPSEIAIVMATYYPGWYRGKLRSIKHTEKVRGDIALDTISDAVKKGFHVVVADGTIGHSFRKELAKIEGLHTIKRLSYKSGPSKRRAIRFASKLTGVKAIVLTEPEKRSIVSDCIFVIVETIMKGEADVVVPRRNEEMFKSTYPAYQYESETEGNYWYNELLRRNRLLKKEDADLDMFFGPRAFTNKPHVVSLFTRSYRLIVDNTSFEKSLFDIEAYSSVLYFPILLGFRKKLKIHGVTVPFRYPKLQKMNEEKGAREQFQLKRKNQKLGIVVELLHFMHYLDRYYKK
jgi:hypothetical protein